MSYWEIASGHLPAPSERHVDKVCWLAREILATHMEDGFEFEADEFAGGQQHVLGDEEQAVTVHETAAVPISDKQEVQLSNVPYVTDYQDNAVPWTEPGYVALRLYPTARLRYTRPVEALKYAGQLVFRLHTPEETAAIFDGWVIADETQIAESDDTKIAAIERLLKVVRRGLRYQAETDPEVYDKQYHSLVPRVSNGKLIGDCLQEFFGE
jgi:hypothetical protein